MRKLKIIGVIGSAIAMLLSATVAFARVEATSTLRENSNGDRKLVATTTQKKIMENARERIETMREQTQASTTMQRQRAAERVSEIKDKVKQQKAQKLAKQFENLNKTWTDHFMNLLERYDAIMQKIQARADIAAGKGKNVTAVTTAIKSANAAIAAVQTVVTAQAAKTYVPDTSAATNGDGEILKSLRDSFQNLHKALFTDLFALRDGPMKSVHSAVQNALQELSKVKGVDDENATTTNKSSQ